MADYAKDVLVETQWVENHLNDDSIRIVEVDENPALYAEAHIPGAIGFDWKKDLQDQVKRDFLGPQEFGELFGGTEFPSIGELPYFLTLAPHSVDAVAAICLFP